MPTSTQESNKEIDLEVRGTSSEAVSWSGQTLSDASLRPQRDVDAEAQDAGVDGRRRQRHRGEAPLRAPENGRWREEGPKRDPRRSSLLTKKWFKEIKAATIPNLSFVLIQDLVLSELLGTS